MSLVVVDSLTEEDIAQWEIAAYTDNMFASTAMLRNKEQKAIESIERFIAEGPCYASVSWGKDSMVIAGLVAQHFPEIPMVYVRVWPIENPHGVLVRDAFLEAYPHVTYHEVHTSCFADETGWHASGTLQEGFKEAARITETPRYISGIRGRESGMRRRRMAIFGTESKNTCAPIGFWRGEDVFGYMAKYDLPVHPAYAMTMGGVLDRERLRVTSLGGALGVDHGRRGWEMRYYPESYREMTRLWEEATGIRATTDDIFL